MPATVLPTPPALPTVTRWPQAFQKAQFQRGGADGNSAEDAALRVEIGGGARERIAKVPAMYISAISARSQRRRAQRAARIAYLFAHG